MARREAGEKVHKNLFDSVGEEFGIKSTLAAEIYYGYERFFYNGEDVDD
jgi:hypothetical protein